MKAKLRKETYYDPKGIMLRFYGEHRCHFEKDYVFRFEDFNDREDAWNEIKRRIENQKWTAKDAKHILLHYLRIDFIKYHNEWTQEQNEENQND